MDHARLGAEASHRVLALSSSASACCNIATIRTGSGQVLAFRQFASKAHVPSGKSAPPWGRQSLWSQVALLPDQRVEPIPDERERGYPAIDLGVLALH